MTESKKLLIIDDDPHIRRLLRIHLRNSGYELHEAGTGEEAMRLAESDSFDVVLLDLILPHYGGFRLCQRFKQTKNKRPYVIVITGEDSPETRETATDCGADAFLGKPFDARQVVEMVASAPAVT